MPFPNEHGARLQNPDKYVRFRRENDKFGEGIDAIWGITKDEKVELQAIRFDKNKFSVSEAKKWLEEHDYKPILFEEAANKNKGQYMEKKYIKIPFEVKNMNEDDEFFFFEGYGSTFGNVDLGKDVLLKGAFADSLAQRMPKLLWQHQATEPVGIFEEAFEDDKGLFLRGKMPKGDTLVNGRVIPQMKIGSVDCMSIGFSITEKEFDENIRKIKKVDLFEVSLVTLPMNPKAVVTGFKSIVPYQDLSIADRDAAWDKGNALKRVREFTDSEDAPSDSYKKAFFWYDKEDKDNFGAYKLPFADVIDNQLKAIPRAVFAIAAALEGARGGVDIPDEEKEGIKKNVEKYYHKMDLKAPWEEKSLKIEDIDSLKDINNYLKCYGLSNNETEGIMAKMREIIKQGKPVDESKSHQNDIITLINSNIDSINNLTKKLQEKKNDY